jgi:hypothetical protein
MRERRAKSMQLSLNLSSIAFQDKKIIKNLFEKKRVNYFKKNLIIENSNNYNYSNIKDINNREEDFQLDEIDENKENFKRFRKKVVHFKKKLYMSTEGNIFKSLNDTENKRKNSKVIKTNRSIQNVYYNTFYNCLFDNLPNNNNQHIENINETYSNNFFINHKFLQKNNTESLLYHKVFSNDNKKIHTNLYIPKKFDGNPKNLGEKKEKRFYTLK